MGSHALYGLRRFVTGCSNCLEAARFSGQNNGIFGEEFLTLS